MLKIKVKATTEGVEPPALTFHFNSSSADPRAEANGVKELLSRLIAGAKATVAQPAEDAGPAPGQGRPSTARFFDDDNLKNDIALQQSLMKADRNLSQMYMEAHSTKPESMNGATFNAQFWSARIDLLRAHAIEASQRKGPYNILAQVKPTLEQNSDPNQPSRMKLNITVEQVQLILTQHPLVKRIYNENVPPLTEGEFWERFFLSKLSKKLRGERTTGLENPDKVFDKYDEYEDISAFSSRQLAPHIPHMIDIEGNEENQGGFKGGNRKDVEMRPRNRADVPIIQTLNSLSEKLLIRAQPTDQVADDSAYDELALRDLRGDAEEQRIMLNIREQGRFFSNQSSHSTKAASTYANQNPDHVLKGLQGDLRTLAADDTGGVHIHASLGIDDESDSDDEGEASAQVGSRASRKDAQQQVLASMRQRQALLSAPEAQNDTPMGLPLEIAAKCRITHATTMEFLHQFWSAFLSGDADRAAEVMYCAEALRRSKDRIHAVAAEAEKAREEAVQKLRNEYVAQFERTGRKRKFNANSVTGGKAVVLKLMETVFEPLDKALGDYDRALAAEGIQASTEA